MEEEEEIPLKIIQLDDFLHFPSIISKEIKYQSSKPKSASSDEQFQLIVPKEIIVFADDGDRKKLGLINKSTNQFSRHLLITSADALRALIPSLLNAKQWIILTKLRYLKRLTKQIPVEEYVLVCLNINHSLVRYEIVTAFDLLKQTFYEMKSAYIVIDFRRILSRWFKNSLKRNDEYPSLSHRLFYRYQIQTNKCLISIGKKNSSQNQKSDIPMEIYIDFNGLPTMVYSIELNNLFTYSMNQKSRHVFKNIGDGLALISVENIEKKEDEPIKPNKCTDLVVSKQDLTEEKCLYSPKDQIKYSSSISSLYEPSEHDQMLFDQIMNNRLRIQMQHQHLMLRATKVLSYSSTNNDSTIKNNPQISY